MAKYEQYLTGDHDQFLNALNDGILEGSASASLEDGSDIKLGDTRVSVRVYERYSIAGANRVSLNVTLAGRGHELFVTAIASGGSQAMFFKINAIGEVNFLDACRQVIEQYPAG